MGEQATMAAVLALIGLAYLRSGRIDALGRFRDAQRVLVIVGLAVAVIGNGLVVWATEARGSMYRDPSWAVVLPSVTALIAIAAVLSVRFPSSRPQRMSAPVSPGARELVGVPAVCAVYALAALAEVAVVGRRHHEAFAYAPPLPPEVTSRYVGQPLPKYESYVADSWVIGVAVAVVVVAVVSVSAAQAIDRGDDPDRPGLAQHVARLGAASALIAGTATALLAADRVQRIDAENDEHYRSARAMLRDAGVTDPAVMNAIAGPRDLQGAAGALETVGSLPNLIGWTLLFLVIGRVFVTNGIRGSSEEFSPPVR